jgi:hypothetical protein
VSFHDDATGGRIQKAARHIGNDCRRAGHPNEHLFFIVALHCKKMSLVGLNVSFDDAGIDLQPTNHSDSYEDEDEDDDQCGHHCVTPKGPAELLFFSDLPTQTISAAALAQQIHISQSQPWASGRSFVTDADDFATAAGTVSSDMMVFSPAPTTTTTSSNNNSPSSSKSPFSDTSSTIAADSSYQQTMFHKDVLAHQTYTVATIRYHEQEELFQDSNMTTPSIAKKFLPAEAPQHADAAEKVYDTAKNVWAWGKGMNIIKPLLNITEVLASKALSTTGNTLEGVDGIVIDQLHGLDDNVLNPAIAAVIGILLGAVGKSEEILKPILLPLLIKFKLIKMDAEVTTTTVAASKKETPEITPDIVAATRIAAAVL